MRRKKRGVSRRPECGLLVFPCSHGNGRLISPHLTATCFLIPTGVTYYIYGNIHILYGALYVSLMDGDDLSAYFIYFSVQTRGVIYLQNRSGEEVRRAVHIFQCATFALEEI